MRPRFRKGGEASRSSRLLGDERKEKNDGDVTHRDGISLKTSESGWFLGCVDPGWDVATKTGTLAGLGPQATKRLMVHWKGELINCTASIRFGIVDHPDHCRLGGFERSSVWKKPYLLRLIHMNFVIFRGWTERKEKSAVRYRDLVWTYDYIPYMHIHLSLSLCLEYKYIFTCLYVRIYLLSSYTLTFTIHNLHGWVQTPATSSRTFCTQDDTFVLWCLFNSDFYSISIP